MGESIAITSGKGGVGKSSTIIGIGMILAQMGYRVCMIDMDLGLKNLDVIPRRLSPQDREVLLWRFEQGLDYDEIAEHLGISETGCRSRVSRSVRRCRALWDKGQRRPDPKQT